jgi:hypothetical protein
MSQSLKNITFKHFLVEFDRADLALQQQHKNKSQQKQDYSKTATDFKSKMDADRQSQSGTTSAKGEPQKGEVLQSPSGKQFIVLGRSNTGFRVRELGGNGKEGNLPHGRKYSPVGKTQLGKTIYKIA